MTWKPLLLSALSAAVAAAIATVVVRWKCCANSRRDDQRPDDDRHLLDIARLTGGLAHEIKNPLSTIKLNLKLLAEDFQTGDSELHRRNHNRLVQLQGEVQRVHDILDDFLKYAGEQELHLATVDLGNSMEELMDFFRPQAEAGRVVLRGSLPEQPLLCRVDPAMFKQAVLNLMINATQVMPDGGELLLRLSENESSAIVEVIDTGPGVPPDMRERIFDPYHSGRPGGSGLGLPTTRRIVRRHGGEIQLDSEPGKGTRFVIRLPTGRRGD